MTEVLQPSKNKIKATLDISIVTYNSSTHLEKLISSLLAQQTDLKQISLSIQDNESSDNTLAVLEELLAPHKDRFAAVIINHGKNIGFGMGHNRALSYGKSPFIFILNPDVILFPDTLELLLQRAIDAPMNEAVWEARQLPYEHPKVYDPVTLETDWFTGAAVLFRRAAFEEVGGFEPKIFLYGEDVDLSFRLRSRGYKLIYYPKASVIHNTYSTPNEIKPQQLLGSTLANLYIRTRFGTLIDVLIGIGLYTLVLLKPSHFLGQKAKMIKNFGRYLTNFYHFRSTSGKKIKKQFRYFEYGENRIGAFYTATHLSQLKQHPKISVLIRTLGKKNLLRQALSSIANQVYPNIEVIIVEDGKESLHSFLQEFQQLNIFYCFLGENKGRCMTGNEALKRSTGEYCIFLDEDDLFYADHLEQLMAKIQATGKEIAYSLSFEVPTDIDQNDHRILQEGSFQTKFHHDYDFITLLHHNFIPIHNVLFHRSFFEDCGGLDPSISYNEDWDLWIRFSLKERPFAFVKKTTSLYRVPLQLKHYAERHETLRLSREQVLKKHTFLNLELTAEELVQFHRKTHPIKAIYDRFVVRIKRVPWLLKPIRKFILMIRR